MLALPQKGRIADEANPLGPRHRDLLPGTKINIRRGDIDPIVQDVLKNPPRGIIQVIAGGASLKGLEDKKRT